MGLFREENRLYPFQADHVALAYQKPTTLLCWDTGTGKSIGALAIASLLLEQDEVDIVVLVCEANKLIEDEWPNSIERFTTIDWKLYHGSPAKRAKIREDLPQLLLTSFDIIKRDAAVFPPKAGKRSRGVPGPGPLLDALDGKRALVILDELTRVANRTSDTHKAMKLFIDTLRAGVGCRVVGMSATPMERDPQSLYDLGRILTPETMCTVAEFERDYVANWDIFRKPSRFKNLTPSDTAFGITPLTDRFSDIILRKRKSDPDVVNFFPKRREMPPTFVTLGKEHQRFYDIVRNISLGLPDYEQRQYVGVLRLIAAHPMSLTIAEGAVAQEIAARVTPEGLAALGSAKTDRMMEYCRQVVANQGEQAVIFTFFAKAVMPLLQQSLEEEGYLVSVNHGGLTMGSKNAAQQTFKRGDTQIFLTSDAGAKGLNLPEATYLLHYERPPLHSLLVQRSDRIHRIDSLADVVFMDSLVARDTLEEGFFNLNLRRNDWSDRVLGDDEAEGEDFISAIDRKELLKIGKANHQ